MSWLVEHDADGEPVRLLWTGPEEQTFEEVLEMERSRCPGCGFPNGWHKLACDRRPDSAGEKHGG